MLFIIEEVICGGADILRVIKFVYKLLNVIFILIPILLIVMIMLDLVKNVIASKEDEMKKNQSLAFKRILMAVFLFLVPTIVEFAIGILGELGVDFMKCVEIATTEEDLSKYEIVWPENNDIPKTDVSNRPSGITPAQEIQLIQVQDLVKISQLQIFLLGIQDLKE